MALTGVDILSIVAGVIQIADIGARLSVKLSSFARKVKSADLAIRDVSQDVALTCSVLRELGHELQKDEEAKLCSNEAMTTARNVIDQCTKVFTDLDDTLDKNQPVPKEAAAFKKWAQRLKYPFIEPHVDLLRTNLERLKSTLLLMLNVIMYAGQLRGKASSSQDLQDQRELIKSLNDETRINQEKVTALSRRIEGLYISSSTEPIAEDDSPPNPSKAAFGINMAQLAPTKKLPAHQVNAPIGFFSRGTGEIAHYCSLVRAVLSEVDAITYGIDYDTRTRIRTGVIETHQTELTHYARRFDHQALLPALNLLKEIYPGITAFGPSQALPRLHVGLPSVYHCSSSPPPVQPTFREVIHKQKMEDRVHHHAMALESVKPVWIKVQRKHLLPETLEHWGLPWEYDPEDNAYILIKKWVSDDVQQDMFEHTRQMRARKAITAPRISKSKRYREDKEKDIPRKTQRQAPKETKIEPSDDDRPIYFHRTSFYTDSSAGTHTSEMVEAESPKDHCARLADLEPLSPATLSLVGPRSVTLLSGTGSPLESQVPESASGLSEPESRLSEPVSQAEQDTFAQTFAQTLVPTCYSKEAESPVSNQEYPAERIPAHQIIFSWPVEPGERFRHLPQASPMLPAWSRQHEPPAIDSYPHMPRPPLSPPRFTQNNSLVSTAVSSPSASPVSSSSGQLGFFTRSGAQLDEQPSSPSREGSPIDVSHLTANAAINSTPSTNQQYPSISATQAAATATAAASGPFNYAVPDGDIKDNALPQMPEMAKQRMFEVRGQTRRHMVRLRNESGRRARNSSIDLIPDMSADSEVNKISDLNRRTEVDLEMDIQPDELVRKWTTLTESDVRWGWLTAGEWK